MRMDSELCLQMERYVSGETSLSDLRRWRRSHLQAIADSSDPVTQRPYGTLAGLLAEYGIGHRPGHRSEESLQGELSAAVAAHGGPSDTAAAARPAAAVGVGTVLSDRHV
jgi:hypothetical protein